MILCGITIFLIGCLMGAVLERSRADKEAIQEAKEIVNATNNEDKRGRITSAPIPQTTKI